MNHQMYCFLSDRCHSYSGCKQHSLLGFQKIATFLNIRIFGLESFHNLTFPVKSEDSSEERCYAGVDLMIEMEWAHGFR
jgi:hypothetical protein